MNILMDKLLARIVPDNKLRRTIKRIWATIENILQIIYNSNKILSRYFPVAPPPGKSHGRAKA